MQRGRPVGSFAIDRTKSDVGTLIRKARFNLRLGLRDVGESVNASVQFISNIENGRAPLPMSHVKPLSDALGIPLKKLAKAALQATDSFKQYKALVG